MAISSLSDQLYLACLLLPIPRQHHENCRMQSSARCICVSFTIFSASAGTKEQHPCWASPRPSHQVSPLRPSARRPCCVDARGEKAVHIACWLVPADALNMRHCHLCQTALPTNSITESAVRARCVSATCKSSPVRDRPPLPFAYHLQFSKLILGHRCIPNCACWEQSSCTGLRRIARRILLGPISRGGGGGSAGQCIKILICPSTTRQ